MPAIAALHSREDIYPEPEEFRPERFLEGAPESYAWIPLGGGVRRCIGASFAQDEPVNAKGDGNTAPDARRALAGDKIFLRSERAGRGDGRVYRIDFTASDGKGGTCEGTATVTVPRGPNVPAVDSAPPSFDSFGP